MAQLITDCPRCGAARTTLDVHADIHIATAYDWQTHHEVFAKCRHCHKGAMFHLQLKSAQAKRVFSADGRIAAYEGSANDGFQITNPITIRDLAAQEAPEHVPEVISRVFREGSSSFSAGCFNAAGAMFRLALDLATKSLLPPPNEQPQPNGEQRKVLAKRLEWLFKEGRLPRDLERLAECVRHDGNDAAHDGTLTKIEAGDLLDFTVELLKRVFTEPGRLAAAEQRREFRRRELREK